MSPAARPATLTVRRSTRFVTWVRSWRAGLAPYDEVAGEIAAGEEHLAAAVEPAPPAGPAGRAGDGSAVGPFEGAAAGYFGDRSGADRQHDVDAAHWGDPSGVEVPLGQVLPTFARLHPDEIRLVLPAPGDPRGLPGPGPFTGAALLAEEGVLAGGHGLVPEVRQHTSGSGDTFCTVVWRRYPLPASVGHPDGMTSVGLPRGPLPSDAGRPGGCSQGGVGPLDGPGPAEAEADLNAAVVAATGRLTKLDVAQWRPELAGALATLRRPEFAGDLPPGYDARARRLYARASMLDQVLALAGQTAPGGAVTGHEARERDEALRPLLAACRRALVAACNAPLSPP